MNVRTALARSNNRVIPALVAGIHLAARSGACGWLDAGDKPRHDKNLAARVP
jgi:hypothetical protein